MVPTAVTLLSLSAWNWSRQQEQQAAAGVIHTEEVLKESNQLLTLVIDAEAGLRGYGLTRNSEFLDSHEQAQTSVVGYIEKLTSLTQDNPIQQTNLRTIRSEVTDYLDFLSETQQLIDQLDSNMPFWQSSQMQTQFSQGKADIDRIRDDIEAVRAEEQSLLAIRRQALNETKHLADWILIVSLLASLISYAIALYLYGQADQKITFRNQQLMIANESLSRFNVALARRNQDLDDFTHTVSHDLKAPLRSIHNLTDWLVTDLDLPADSETSRYADLLQQRVTKMQLLIDGLLAYSRADRTADSMSDLAGPLVESVNVGELVRELVRSLDMPPNFKVIIAPDLPTLQTERLLLQQVFSNLITNAYKHHAGPTGSIAIATEAIPTDSTKTISAQRTATERAATKRTVATPRFTVTDDGPGIAPEYHDRIFKIFQTAASGNANSSGIGLSIVKKIVERRGGEVGFTSEVGKGTAFYFTWP
ncbi:MAG: CHASE3 domain-containing protein [Phormidesmis sp.]